VSGTFLLGVLLGVVAALLLNVGKGVQKQQLALLLDGRGAFSRVHRRDLALWCAGVAMSMGSTVPYGFGLQLSRSPSSLSSVSGIGLVGLTVYAVKVIGERLSPRDLAGIGLVVVATSALGAVRAADPPPAYDAAGAAFAQALLVVLLPVAAGCLLALLWRRLHGVAWGLAAGACIGLALFAFDVALSGGGSGLAGLVRTPWTWLALLFGLSATVVTQVGFARARALEVVPCVASATIVVPWVLEAVAYGSRPAGPVLALVAAIVAGVVCLGSGVAARSEEG